MDDSPSADPLTTRPRAFLAAVTLTMLLVAGPNLLTEAQVAARRRPPVPQRSSAAQLLLADAGGLTGRARRPVPTIAELVDPAGIGTHRVLGAPQSVPSWVIPSAAA